jgi:hypothetical protein
VYHIKNNAPELREEEKEEEDKNENNERIYVQCLSANKKKAIQKGSLFTTSFVKTENDRPSSSLSLSLSPLMQQGMPFMFLFADISFQFFLC